MESASGVFFSVASTHSFRCTDCVVTYNIDHAIVPQGALIMAKGTFVAPVSGYYLFQFHAMTEPKNLAKVQVKKYSTFVTYIYNPKSLHARERTHSNF